MANSSALSDGAQQADMVSNENAEAKFGTDQAETNMVKLVDGKLVPIGNTEDDVADQQLRNRYSSDEERSLQNDDTEPKTYENTNLDLIAAEQHIPDDPIAEAEITGNPDAGSTVNTGLPSEDNTKNKTTPTSSFGHWQFLGNATYQPSADMIPSTPGTPNPDQPIPGVPETSPPTPPIDPEYPAPTPDTPEIPDLPDMPKPPIPDIQHHASLVTFTTSGPAIVPTNGPKPDGYVANSDEGMEDEPDTGESAQPYDVNAKDQPGHKPGEKPEQAQEMEQQPKETLDESSVKAQDMIKGIDRSDQKSTEGLDRKYNDPDAARETAS